MLEISSLVPAATRISKFPSMSVTTPLVVPGTTTEAPMTGSPFVSTTLPLVMDCANATDPANSRSMAVSAILRWFFIMWEFWLNNRYGYFL